MRQRGGTHKDEEGDESRVDRVHCRTHQHRRHHLPFPPGPTAPAAAACLPSIPGEWYFESKLVRSGRSRVQLKVVGRKMA